MNQNAPVEVFSFSNLNILRIFVLFFILACDGSFWISLSSGQEFERGEDKEVLDFESATLTGNWNGSRTILFDRGINLEVEYFGDVFSTVSGGLTRKTDISGLLELELHIDGDRLLNWKGSRFFVFGFGTHGKDFKENIGSVHDVSNIAAPDTFKLYELWYEQSLFEDQLSILLGLYDLNGEFDVRPTAKLFINGAFGIGLDFSESGKNGPSTYPDTSLATRVRIQPVESLYYQGAVLDGVPGDPDNPKGTQIRLKSDDGFLVANEIGYESELSEPGLKKAGIGGWFYTTDLDDLVQAGSDGNPVQRSGTYGIYAFTDGTIFLESGTDSQGLFFFFRIGGAEADVNKVDLYMDGGLVYRGLISDRPEDSLGLGVSIADFSDGFKEQQKLRDIFIDDPEVLLELTYKLKAYSGIYLQPDFQYLFNPSQEKGTSNAFSIGFRLEVAL